MKTVRINLHYLTYFALTDDKRFYDILYVFFNFHVLKLSNVFTRETLARLLAMALCLCLSQVRVLWKRLNEFSWFLAWELPSTYPVLYFSLAVLDPRVSHAMDALFPLIFVLCHSDWLFHGESCPPILHCVERKFAYLENKGTSIWSSSSVN